MPIPFIIQASLPNKMFKFLILHCINPFASSDKLDSSWFTTPAVRMTRPGCHLYMWSHMVSAYNSTVPHTRIENCIVVCQIPAQANSYMIFMVGNLKNDIVLVIQRKKQANVTSGKR